MTAAPRTVLVVGATGNTGRSTVRTLSADLAGQDIRILALTRSTDSASAKLLAALPLVEVEAKFWPEIDAAWLEERNVVKAFVASHNEDNQFTDESLFYTACLGAGVEYVVRISTWAPYIGPASPIFYGRSHWAIETMLETPAFDALKWTSLRPAGFSSMFLPPAAEAVKTYRSTGKFEPLKVAFGRDVAGALINPDDVGVVAGKLLALVDPSAHTSQKYDLNGPADFTGKDVVDEVERLTGGKVTDVTFGDRSFLEAMHASGTPDKVMPSLYKALDMGTTEGKSSLKVAAPTSQAVLDLAPPTTTFRETLLALIGDQ